MENKFKGLTFKSLSQLGLGIIIGIIATLNLQARDGSSFETAASYVRAPFYVDSKESARWGN